MAYSFLLGAGRVIAIDRYPERLQMAQKDGGAEVINYEESGDVLDALKEMTDGRGPDACVDAVGLEAHDMGAAGIYDRAKQAVMSETDRPAPGNHGLPGWWNRLRGRSLRRLHR